MKYLYYSTFLGSHHLRQDSISFMSGSGSGRWRSCWSHPPPSHRPYLLSKSLANLYLQPRCYWSNCWLTPLDKKNPSNVRFLKEKNEVFQKILQNTADTVKLKLSSPFVNKYCFSENNYIHKKYANCYKLKETTKSLSLKQVGVQSGIHKTSSILAAQLLLQVISHTSNQSESSVEVSVLSDSILDFPTATFIKIVVTSNAGSLHSSLI